MNQPPTHPLVPYIPKKSSIEVAREFYDVMKLRRTVREFSDRHVPLETIESIVRAAGTAPSGANKQPWHFACVSDPEIKREIREAAEAEEREFYHRRATERWLDDLRPLGTDEHKPFLEIAPWLIIVFKLVRDEAGSDGVPGQVYYVDESVGIAVGLLLAAAHQAGLATLTHTPSPMKFLAHILRRPDNERPFLLIPVGYPAEDCRVPDIKRKSLSDIMTVNRP